MRTVFDLLFFLFFLAMVTVVLTGCVPAAPSVTQAAAQPAAPLNDPTLFDVTGVVVGEVGSLARQTKPASGSVVGVSGGATYGSYVGPQIGGKSFVRIQVQAMAPRVVLAQIGDIVVLKGEDSKLSILSPGDLVTVRCRLDYEAITATNVSGAKDSSQQNGVWEFDVCRMLTPVIQVVADGP